MREKWSVTVPWVLVTLQQGVASLKCDPGKSFEYGCALLRKTPSPSFTIRATLGRNGLGREREACSDHAVSSHELGKLLFAHALGPGGPSR